jgi:hypothetical protein
LIGAVQGGASGRRTTGIHPTGIAATAERNNCGGLNSTVAGLATRPFDPFEEFKGEFRVIAADLRNAKGGQSSGPLEVDPPCDAYTGDHIGLMDHLRIRESQPSKRRVEKR